MKTAPQYVVGLVTRPVMVVDHKATGSLVRLARLKAGVSLRALAKGLKISPPFLSDLELGRRNWTEERIEEVKKILLP